MTIITERVYEHLFYEAHEETNKAVEILRRCLSEADLKSTDLFLEVRKFVEDWDKAGEPFHDDKDNRL